MRSRSCRLSPILLAIGFAAFLAASPVVAADEGESGGSDLMLVLDASGSMWGQVQNEHKIVIARRVLADVIGKVPAGVNIGLVAYGHRREADCDDIETVVPLGPTDHAALVKKINSLNAKGKTPITKTLTQVFAELVKHERPATVVFVSDGIETCGGDPCQAVRDAKAQGIKFVMHVIGFDVGDVDVSQLECAAQAGGGLYFSAADAGQFANALGQAVAIKPETPLGKLSVKTTANGKLRVKVTRNGALSDATIKIYRAGTKEQVAGGRTYVNPASNPSEAVLAAGTYDVEVASVEIENKPATRWEAIAVASNETVVREHEFLSGMLQLGVEQGGRLLDATVQVLDPDTKQSIGSGRTYTNPKSNPKSFILSPGRYLVVVTPVKKDAGAKREIDVDIQPNGKVEHTIDFAK